MKYFFLFFVALSLDSMVAQAQDPGVYLTQIWNLIGSFGQLPFLLKMSAIVMLLVNSLKIPFFAPLWDKLGKFKLAAPAFFSIVLGFIDLAMQGKLSLSGLAAYFFAGVGAPMLYEFLEIVKEIPGVNPLLQAVIAFVENLLAKKAPDPALPPPAAPPTA